MTNWFKKDLTAAEKFARMIVLKRVAIVAFVTGLLSVLVSLHLITGDLSNYAVSWINRALDVVGLLVATFYAQAGTTPANPDLRPVSSNGLPFVEQGADSVSESKPNGDSATVGSLDDAPDPTLAENI